MNKDQFLHKHLMFKSFLQTNQMLIYHFILYYTLKKFKTILFLLNEKLPLGKSYKDINCL